MDKAKLTTSLHVFGKRIFHLERCQEVECCTPAAEQDGEARHPFGFALLEVAEDELVEEVDRG